MARPRIFISSTFYDLKQVRYDLENFLVNIGYEPIMNDRGHIPYSGHKPLEINCYDEVSRCDILIGIIGGNYGTSSKEDSEYSISMKEIKTAIKSNKQVFIFVDKNVLNENKLYIENKSVESIKYVAVNDIKIHKFIEEIRNLHMNNAIIPFESASDIVSYLKEQFAGLFQRLLQEKATITEQTTYYDLKETISELKAIVSEIEDRNEDFFKKFDSTIFVNNPVTRLLLKILGIKNANIYIKNKNAFLEFLYLLNYTEESSNDREYVFRNSLWNEKKTLIVSKEVFDDFGNIKKIPIKKAEELISFKTEVVEDDDLPF